MGRGTRFAIIRLPVTYTFKKGDTFKGILDKFDADYVTVLNLNNLRGEREIEPGRTILLGYKRELATKDEHGTLKNSPGWYHPDLKPQSPTALETPKTQNHNVKETQDPKMDNSKSILLRPVSMKFGIVSVFGPRWGSFHDGLDFGCPNGTPIYAAHSGQIVYADNGLSGYGNLVILKNSKGTVTVYAHNSEIYVEKGDYVKRGERISDSGSTGRVTGPHLHFEVRVPKKGGGYATIDPLPLITGGNMTDIKNRENNRLNALF